MQQAWRSPVDSYERERQEETSCLLRLCLKSNFGLLNTLKLRRITAVLLPRRQRFVMGRANTHLLGVVLGVQQALDDDKCLARMVEVSQDHMPMRNALQQRSTIPLLATS